MYPNRLTPRKSNLPHGWIKKREERHSRIDRAHEADSSEWAFQTLAEGCFREYSPQTEPVILQEVVAERRRG